MECFYLVFFTLATLLLVSSCSCKSKLWRCLILGFLPSAACSGLHSRTLAAGSRALGKLWPPLLYAHFNGGHWRPSQSRWHETRMTNPGFGNEKEKGCLQSVNLLNKSDMKPQVFLRYFGISRLLALAISISVLHCGPISIQGRSCVIQMIISPLFQEATRMLFSPLFIYFFFSSKGC